MIRWKIFDADRTTSTHVALLYHGVEGHKLLKRGEWHEANERWVVDGSGQEPYLSGFHCFRFYSEAEAYAARFQRPVVIESIRTRGIIRVKPSNRSVILTPAIFLENGA